MRGSVVESGSSVGARRPRFLEQHFQRRHVATSGGQLAHVARDDERVETPGNAEVVMVDAESEQHATLGEVRSTQDAALDAHDEESFRVVDGKKASGAGAGCACSTDAFGLA